MSRAPSVIDRARIEWAVWSLDQRLYELPRRARIERRRELRANLLDATPDIGVSAALRRLGDHRRLAEDYLEAELGPGRRPSWWAAVLVVTAFPLFFLSLSTDVAHAFRAGIVASDPQASGSFTTKGIAGLQSDITYTLEAGQGSYVGGAMTPLCWFLMAVVAIVVGRLWLIPRAAWRRRADLV
ncbi:MAG TPA: hypothetical protein VHK88_14155 [Aquihabitans sp.]|nr:hypothetical protein [Aquihabitans sp.]